MSFSTHRLAALGIADAEAFNDDFCERFLDSSLGQKTVERNLALMEEAMKQMYNVIEGEGKFKFRLQLADVRLEEISLLEDIMNFIADQSEYFFAIEDLPDGDKAVHLVTGSCDFSGASAQTWPM
jgi:hypothetical protein